MKPSGTIAGRMLSRRVLPLVSMLLALLSLLLPWGQSAHAHTTTITQVVTVSEQGDALRFPADARSMSLTLPDDWSETRSRQNTPVWYRATFDRHGHMERERMALLIDRACGSALVLLNGEVLHDPSTQRDVTRLCRTPLLLPMSNALLRETGNQLDIKVTVARSKRSAPMTAPAGCPPSTWATWKLCKRGRNAITCCASTCRASPPLCCGCWGR